MIRRRDPAELTESERFAELVELFARGALRWRAAEVRPTAKSQNRLDDDAEPAAACGSRTKNPKDKESAA